MYKYDNIAFIFIFIETIASFSIDIIFSLFAMIDIIFALFE